MLKIALVGNIASGKSTIEKILKKRGFAVYDTDEIAHKILENSTEIKEMFPDAVTDGAINRKLLADIVFNDKFRLKTLEKFIHPKVKKKIEEIDDKIAFVSVPQLFEANMESLFDKIIFISAPKQIRLERLIKRNNLSAKDAELRLNAQADEEDKIKKSDFVIYNDGNLAELEKKVFQILTNIC